MKLDMANATLKERLLEASKEEAKKMILQFFEEKRQLDYIEIISTLNLDLELIIKVCAELEEENIIEEIG